MREAIKMENSEISSVDIMREISSKWAHLDSETKKQYDQMAAQDRVRFEKEMDSYKSQDGNSEKFSNCATPKSKQPNFTKIDGEIERYKTADSPNKSVANSDESYEGECLFAKSYRIWHL